MSVGTDDFVYIILDKGMGSINTRAICIGKEEYDNYAKTHDLTGTRTMVVNPDSPEFKNSDEFMDKVYSSNYAIVDYYDGVPVTGYEEEMIIDAESNFHCHMKSRVGEIRHILSKDFIKFSEREKYDIELMLNIIRAKADYCTDEEDIPEDEPCNRINYRELIIQGKLLV